MGVPQLVLRDFLEGRFSTPLLLLGGGGNDDGVVGSGEEAS